MWTQSELESVLDNQQAQAIIRHYGVQADGNVNPAQDPHGELVNKVKLRRGKAMVSGR